MYALEKRILMQILKRVIALVLTLVMLFEYIPVQTPAEEINEASVDTR